MRKENKLKPDQRSSPSRQRHYEFLQQSPENPFKNADDLDEEFG